MPDAAEQVAILEAEMAQAVSASIVAEAAAREAVASANALDQQLTANNAQTVREWSDDLERNKDHIKWMQSEMTAMATSLTELRAETVMLRTQAETLQLSLSAMATPTPSPEPQKPSSVVAVDLQAASVESPPASPSPPQPKRYKRL